MSKTTDTIEAYDLIRKINLDLFEAQKTGGAGGFPPQYMNEYVTNTKKLLVEVNKLIPQEEAK